jgi:hypothetical protein
MQHNSAFQGVSVLQERYSKERDGIRLEDDIEIRGDLLVSGDGS